MHHRPRFVDQRLTLALCCDNVAHVMAKITFTSLRSDYPQEDADEDGNITREYGKFKATFWNTLEKLKYELERLGAKSAVLEVDGDSRSIQRSSIRIGAKVFSPRVRLSFHHPALGLLQYPSGTYHNYEHNVRAIALTLEAQRAIERYGATRDGQQYKGWQGLPPVDDQELFLGSALEAAEFIAENAELDVSEADSILGNHGYFNYCYRTAAKNCHPDSGGSDPKFKTLQQARELLDAHFSKAKVA